MLHQTWFVRPDLRCDLAAIVPMTVVTPLCTDTCLWLPLPPQVLARDMLHPELLLTVLGERLQPLMQDPSLAGAACQVIVKDKAPTCPLLYTTVAVLELSLRVADNRVSDEERIGLMHNHSC